MSMFEKKCDYCGRVVDVETPDADDAEMCNYSTIAIKVESRNPKKRALYSQQGSLVICDECMHKGFANETFRNMLKKMVSRVEM